MGVLLRVDTQQALHEALVEKQPRLIVEIGSWIGYSCCFMASRAPEAKIICLDTWRGSRDIYEMRSTEPFIADSYDRFLSNTWHLKERVHPFKIDGVNGMRMLWETGLVPDLVFIDGGHEYESAYGDIHMTMRCFPSTLIVLDDIDHNGVAEAAAECCKKFSRQLTVTGTVGATIT